MEKLEKEQHSCDCPNPKCKKEIEYTPYEIFLKKELKCKKCGSGYKLESSEIYHLKTSLNDYEKARYKFYQTLDKLISNADEIITQK